MTFKDAKKVRDTLAKLGIPWRGIYAIIGPVASYEAYKFEVNDPLGRVFHDEERYSDYLIERTNSRMTAPTDAPEGASLVQIKKKFYQGTLSDFFESYFDVVHNATKEQATAALLNWQEVRKAYEATLAQAGKEMWEG